jgi:hypothetical protein
VSEIYLSIGPVLAALNNPTKWINLSAILQEGDEEYTAAKVVCEQYLEVHPELDPNKKTYFRVQFL